VKEVVVNLVDGRIRHYVVERQGRRANVEPKALSLAPGGEVKLDVSLEELRDRRSTALEK
jgi:hypothetical protein